MCIVIADTHVGAGVFVATDTRLTYADGSWVDPGGKIVQTAAGWAAGVGGYKPVSVALSALRDADDLSVIDRAKRASDIVTRALNATNLPADFEEKEELDPKCGVVFLIEPRYAIVALIGGRAQEVLNVVGTMPPFPENDGHERYLEMCADVESAGDDLAARIRATAKHFAITHRVTDWVSGVMEAGYLLDTPQGERLLLKELADAFAEAYAALPVES